MMLSKFFSPLMEPIEKDNVLFGLSSFALLIPIVTAAFYKDVKVIIIVFVLSFVISILLYCFIKYLRK